MPTYDGWTEDPKDTQDRHELRLQMVELYNDMHPAEEAYILDSHCTCTRHFVGTGVEEKTCERCALLNHKHSIPFDDGSDR